MTWRGPKSQQQLAYASRLLALLAAYLLFAAIGLATNRIATFVSLVWPASGVSLACLLLGGLRLWPAVFLGAMTVSTILGAPVPVALGVGAGNALAAVVGALALGRIFERYARTGLSANVLGLALLTVIACPAISAVVGTSSLALGGMLDPGRFW